ncbi:uncharacterized protein H6S33_005200 [Morchella sextelata]|uniref:uncharacterized protein n=1 Tax=Morchella sextelata TaxID=1174677 RepID=UPI001D039C55|nr:uncharacterized protein H6S33_005200 [Morchella sextelata]KAH0605218.1 hypothetical protein H6S33_005200 [Morchella sextelata]
MLTMSHIVLTDHSRQKVVLHLLVDLSLFNEENTGCIGSTKKNEKSCESVYEEKIFRESAVGFEPLTVLTFSDGGDGGILVCTNIDGPFCRELRNGKQAVNAKDITNPSPFDDHDSPSGVPCKFPYRKPLYPKHFPRVPQTYPDLVIPTSSIILYFVKRFFFLIYRSLSGLSSTKTTCSTAASRHQVLEPFLSLLIVFTIAHIFSRTYLTLAGGSGVNSGLSLTYNRRNS